MTHTPGPWAVHRVYGRKAVPDAVLIQSAAPNLPWNDPCILAVREDWLRVCEPDTNERSQRMSADLRLIAQAPALLDALRECLSLYGELEAYPDVVARAREVIRQATTKEGTTE